MITTLTKVCTSCKQEKTIKEFYKADRSHCKDCERISASTRMKRYYATPRGKAAQALQDSRKTARKHGAYDDLTHDDVMFTFALSGGQCIYCGKYSDSIELEHIRAFSKGGANTLANITTSCRTCNQAKNNHALLTWYIRGDDKEEKAEGIAGAILEIARNRDMDVLEVVDRLKDHAIQIMNESRGE